jgi:hypothetical protein
VVETHFEVNIATVEVDNQMPIIQVQVGKNIFEDVFTKRDVVHSNHIFVITMRLMSKPTCITTSNVLFLHVHVVATSCNHICNYKKG